jgi:hypothetical protein
MFDWLIIAIFAGGMAVLVSSCSLITPEQTQQAKDAISKQITPENVEKIKEILK